ncbi:MAG: hypothetical protein MUC86_03305 [Burkholderiaceae bacterium]|jgi:hypothetical protein|nr:hypothetical protein [Burkholderiaceae bacterium]
MSSASASVLRLTALALLATGTLLASGCATVTREPTQRVSIVAVDAADQPLPGMRCRVANGAAEYYGDSPMHDVPVRRSFSNLEVECRRGPMVARGTAVSRGGASWLQGILPGGSALVAVDLVTGHHYSYPIEIRVRAGEHLVFDISRPRGDLQADTGNRP